MKLCHHYSIAYNNSITDFNSHVYTQFLITKRRLVLVTFTTHVFAGTEKTNALVKYAFFGFSSLLQRGLRGCLFDRENIEILSTVLVRSPSASVTCIVGLSLISSAICRTQTDRFLEIFGGQYKKFNVPNMGRTAKMLTARSSFQLVRLNFGLTIRTPVMVPASVEFPTFSIGSSSVTAVASDVLTV
jgi:hypothetical protein